MVFVWIKCRMPALFKERDQAILLRKNDNPVRPGNVIVIAMIYDKHRASLQRERMPGDLLFGIRVICGSRSWLNTPRSRLQGIVTVAHLTRTPMKGFGHCVRDTTYSHISGKAGGAQ